MKLQKCENVWRNLADFFRRKWKPNFGMRSGAKVCWNPIEKQWTTLLASVLRTKHTHRKRSYQTAAAMPAPLECTAPHSKIRLNFVKHFRIFAVLFSKLCLFFAILVRNSPILMKLFLKFSILYGKYQNLLDTQVSWDFATNIFEIFRKWFSKS